MPAVATTVCLALAVLACGCLTGCSRDGGDRKRGVRDGASYARLQDAVEQVLVQRWGGSGGARLDERGGRDWPVTFAGGEGAVRCRVIRLKDAAAAAATVSSLAEALATAGARVLWQEDLGDGAWRLDVGATGLPTHTLALVPPSRADEVQWSAAAADPRWTALSTGAGPIVALIIDDWGQRLDGAARQILDLPVPLTLAVLPGLPHSREVAALATSLALPADDKDPGAAGSSAEPARGRSAAGCPVELRLATATAPEARREIFLHLPMQPQGYPQTNPGPDALLVGMAEADLVRRLDLALAQVPGARGVNNHMGSAATADLPLMSNLMAQLHARGLRFVDSLTTPRSVAYRAARDAGVPAARNRLFLDVDYKDQVAIAKNLAALVAVARKTGQVVGIGHPHPATAEVLVRELPRYAAAGIRFVTVSELLALESNGANRAREAADVR